MTTDSLLDRIDTVTVDECHQCGRVLDADGPSEWFCGPACQGLWQEHQADVERLTGYREPWTRPHEFPGVGQDVASWGVDGPSPSWRISGSWEELRAAVAGGRDLTFPVQISDPEEPVTAPSWDAAVVGDPHPGRVSGGTCMRPTWGTRTDGTPTAFFCNRSAGHQGQHVACTPDRVVAVSPNEDTPAAEDTDITVSSVEFLDSVRPHVNVAVDHEAMERIAESLREACARTWRDCVAPTIAVFERATAVNPDAVRHRTVDETPAARALRLRQTRNTGPRVHADPRRNRRQ